MQMLVTNQLDDTLPWALRLQFGATLTINAATQSSQATSEVDAQSGVGGDILRIESGSKLVMADP